MKAATPQNLLAAAALAVGLISCADAFAKAEFASKDEAVAMVKKGIGFIKTNGKDKGYTAITNKEFSDRDLYLVVYGLDGKCLAHGANPKQAGRDLIDMKDVDGKPFIKERVELAKAKPSFWQDYKFTNPTNKKVEPKQMYCEKLDDTIVCGGVYKQ
ncbi:MAG: cache domain-containing protein [Betaproteobacteria bacterium]|nr:cache domain-containing protein [Betaproteobacteria bacterium]